MVWQRLRRILCRMNWHSGEIVTADEVDESVDTPSAFVCSHCDYVRPVPRYSGIYFVHQHPPAEFAVQMERMEAYAVLEDLERIDNPSEETERMRNWLRGEL